MDPKVRGFRDNRHVRYFVYVRRGRRSRWQPLRMSVIPPPSPGYADVCIAMRVSPWKVTREGTESLGGDKTTCDRLRLRRPSGVVHSGAGVSRRLAEDAKDRIQILSLLHVGRLLEEELKP